MKKILISGQNSLVRQCWCAFLLTGCRNMINTKVFEQCSHRWIVEETGKICCSCSNSKRKWQKRFVNEMKIHLKFTTFFLFVCRRTYNSIPNHDKLEWLVSMCRLERQQALRPCQLVRDAIHKRHSMNRDYSRIAIAPNAILCHPLDRLAYCCSHISQENVKNENERRYKHEINSWHHSKRCSKKIMK